MADVARMLELMHPMREPAPPAPIAPYVAMLAVGCALAAIAFVFAWQTRRRRADLRRSAETALAASRRLAPAERLAAQAALLRRLVRAIADEGAARTQGSVWLQTLDRIFGTHFFTQGDGQAYGDALYARRPVVDIDALDHALAGMIAKLPARPAHAA